MEVVVPNLVLTTPCRVLYSVLDVYMKTWQSRSQASARVPSQQKILRTTTSQRRRCAAVRTSLRLLQQSISTILIEYRQQLLGSRAPPRGKKKLISDFIRYFIVFYDIVIVYLILCSSPYGKKKPYNNINIWRYRHKGGNISASTWRQACSYAVEMRASEAEKAEYDPRARSSIITSFVQICEAIYSIYTGMVGGKAKAVWLKNGEV